MIMLMIHDHEGIFGFNARVAFRKPVRRRPDVLGGRWMDYDDDANFFWLAHEAMCVCVVARIFHEVGLQPASQTLHTKYYY